jgi:DNA-directed RNA polymerase subunit M/transcription elongation factor TFIIS|tara:strand:- start:5994 stop:6356 length:363 start_codon:yes stop_codon:yes gene_type:complete
MEVSFCKSCENMLYIYVDSESKLYHGCKACGETSEIDSKTQLIYNNSNQSTMDNSELININPYVCHDITLPIIKNNKNIKCKNELCDAEKTDIKYVKYDSVDMKFIYICQHCGSKWKNNL